MCWRHSPTSYLGRAVKPPQSRDALVHGARRAERVHHERRVRSMRDEHAQNPVRVLHPRESKPAHSFDVRALVERLHPGSHAPTHTSTRRGRIANEQTAGVILRGPNHCHFPSTTADFPSSECRPRSRGESHFRPTRAPARGATFVRNGSYDATDVPASHRHFLSGAAVFSTSEIRQQALRDSRYRPTRLGESAVQRGNQFHSRHRRPRFLNSGARRRLLRLLRAWRAGLHRPRRRHTQLGRRHEHLDRDRHSAGTPGRRRSLLWHQLRSRAAGCSCARGFRTRGAAGRSSISASGTAASRATAVSALAPAALARSSGDAAAPPKSARAESTAAACGSAKRPPRTYSARCAAFSHRAEPRSPPAP